MTRLAFALALLASAVVPSGAACWFDGFEGCEVEGATPPGWQSAVEGAMLCDGMYPNSGYWAARLLEPGEACVPVELDAPAVVDVSFYATANIPRIAKVAVGVKDESMTEWVAGPEVRIVPYGYELVEASFDVWKAGRYGLCVGRWHESNWSPFVDDVTVTTRPMERVFLPVVGRDG